ncbi:hypothetical protein ACKFKG_03185 [Phormidesmis sp. 146-35]
MLADSWRLIGAVSFNRPQTDVSASPARSLTSRVVRIKTVSSTRANWRRGCYMKQMYVSAETDNRVVPLNQDSIFELSHLATGRYELVFTPVRWLPDLVVWVWEYTGNLDFLPESVDRGASVNDGTVSD